MVDELVDLFAVLTGVCLGELRGLDKAGLGLVDLRRELVASLGGLIVDRGPLIRGLLGGVAFGGFGLLVDLLAHTRGVERVSDLSLGVLHVLSVTGFGRERIALVCVLLHCFVDLSAVMRLDMIVGDVLVVSGVSVAGVGFGCLVGRRPLIRGLLGGVTFDSVGLLGGLTLLRGFGGLERVGQLGLGLVLLAFLGGGLPGSRGLLVDRVGEHVAQVGRNLRRRTRRWRLRIVLAGAIRNGFFDGFLHGRRDLGGGH